MANKQNGKTNGKADNKSTRNSITNNAYNGMGNCTSSTGKNAVEAEKSTQAKKNNNSATDCSH